MKSENLIKVLQKHKQSDVFVIETGKYEENIPFIPVKKAEVFSMEDDENECVLLHVKSQDDKFICDLKYVIKLMKKEIILNEKLQSKLNKDYDFTQAMIHSGVSDGLEKSIEIIKNQFNLK